MKRLGSAETRPNKQEVTPDDIEKIRAAEEKYKDNPAVLNLIDKFKQGFGISTDEQPAEPEPPPPPEHISTVPASREAAHEAYSKKDYATALEQYKALAAAGDPEASAIVGMMYEGGIGTDADPVTAQAWYKRAAESGSENNRFADVVTDKTVEYYEGHRLSGDDTEQANLMREEIDKEISIYGTPTQPGGVETGSGLKIITYTHYPASAATAGNYRYIAEPRAAKITLTKIERPAYVQPQTHSQPQHLQPEKFTRSVSTGDG